MRCLISSEESVEFPEEKAIWPFDGRASSAVIFKSVVFPEPFVPHESDALPRADFQRNASQGHAYTVAFLDAGKNGWSAQHLGHRCGMTRAIRGG